MEFFHQSPEAQVRAWVLIWGCAVDELFATASPSGLTTKSLTMQWLGPVCRLGFQCCE